MLDIVVMELKIIFLACKLYACSPLCGVASFIIIIKIINKKFKKIQGL